MGKLKKGRKIIIKSIFIGLVISLPLFGLLSLLSYLSIPIFVEALFFPFFPWVKYLDPDAGLILFYLIPIYGIIAGAVIGYIIASLTKKYEKKKSIFKRGGFYLLIFILIWMTISLTQPIKGISDSFTEPPFYKEIICKWGQGCMKYDETELCAEKDAGDWREYPYPKVKNKEDWVSVSYPQVPIDQLPSEAVFSCGFTLSPNPPMPKEILSKDLVNGTSCSFTDKEGKVYYSRPSIHPLYGGFSLKDNKIYYNNLLCGEVGKIRYRSRCKCEPVQGAIPTTSPITET